MRLSVAILLVSLSLLATAKAPAEVPDSLQYFVGTFACTTTIGDTTISSTSNGSQWGQWIHFNINTPAQNNRGAITGSGYLGWDPATNGWVYSEIDSDGNYFVTHSQSDRVGKSSWSTQYPASGTTNIDIKGRNRYTLDYSWTQSGRNMSGHELCVRQ